MIKEDWNQEIKNKKYDIIKKQMRRQLQMFRKYNRDENRIEYTRMKTELKKRKKEIDVEKNRKRVEEIQRCENYTDFWKKINFYRKRREE